MYLTFTALVTNTQTPKASFIIGFFAAINHNYDHKQSTLKHRNTQNGSKSTNHRSQTMTFWTCFSKVLFPKRSAKMIPCEQRPFNLPTVDKSCLARQVLRWLTAAKNANVSWLLNFRVHVFLKSTKGNKKVQPVLQHCCKMSWKTMLRIQPPMNRTCLLTNLIVASYVNYDF